MRFDTDRYLAALKKAKRKQRSTCACLLVLSVLVSANVFWFMRGTGIAMASDPDTEITETDETSDTSEDAEITECAEQIDEEINTDDTTVNAEIVDEINESETTETEETGLSDIASDATSSLSALNPFLTSLTESGIKVTVDYDKGAFPDGAIMTAVDVEKEEIEDTVLEEFEEDQEPLDMIAVDITFTDIFGNEIEPEEGYSVNVSIEIPEEIRMEGEDYSLIHIDSDGNASEIEDAVITEEKADFSSDSFSIYVLTALGEKHKDEIREWIEEVGWVTPVNGGYIANDNNFPYVLGIDDEVILVSYTTDNSKWLYIDYNDTSVVNIDNNYETPGPADANGLYRHVSRITANGTGKVEIKQDIGNGQMVSFFIEVRSDRKTHTIDFNDPYFAQFGNPSNAYEINVGDIINLVGSTEVAGNYFYLIDRNGNQVKPSYFLNIPEDQMHKDQNGNITAILEALNNNYWTYNAYDCIGVGIWVNDNPYDPNSFRKVYFRIGSRQMLDHADIEIAENGEYDCTKIYNEDGVLKKEVTSYVSCVYSIYDCSLYKENGDYCTFYEYDGDNEDILDGVHGYTGSYESGGDYWKNPNKKPGETQYELTSKYAKDQNGTVVHESNKKYCYPDVDHARFDVQLELIPQTKKVYHKVGDEWVLDETIDISRDPVEYLDHVIFNLDKTAVVDAYNKCPLSNGLDFSVQADMAMVQFEASKILLNGQLTADEFEFGVYEQTYNPSTNLYDERLVATATNDADGKVEFPMIALPESREYRYVIREIKGTRTDILYDSTSYEVKVTVNTADMSMDIEAATLDFKFTNKAGYVLPDTGGIGTGIYMVSGIVMISTALILFGFRKRKRRKKSLRFKF